MGIAVQFFCKNAKLSGRCNSYCHGKDSAGGHTNVYDTDGSYIKLIPPYYNKFFGVFPDGPFALQPY